MLKKEIIWREILHKTLHKDSPKFQQQDLAKKFEVSLSTVHNALKVPRKTGAVQRQGRFFILRDPEKMLYIWATFREPEKDIIYKTYVSGPVKEIEKLMPSTIVFGAYSAYALNFPQSPAPADYDKVYVYTKKRDLPEIKKRFPVQKGSPNLFVLEADKFLKNYGETTSPSQTFADIWNFKDWFAREFCRDLAENIKQQNRNYA